MHLHHLYSSVIYVFVHIKQGQGKQEIPAISGGYFGQYQFWFCFAFKACEEENERKFHVKTERVKQSQMTFSAKIQSKQMFATDIIQFVWGSYIYNNMYVLE